jgi:hypothetical protein
MRKKKPSYRITLPEPCKEDWNEMSPIQQGRHCSVCEKDLVDFTHMSDNSLIDFLSKKKDEKTCGRFHSSQLDRVILSSEQRDSGFLLRASAVLAMVGGSFMAAGQESDTSKVQQEGVTVTKEDVMNIERGNNEHIGVVIGSYSQVDTAVNKQDALIKKEYVIEGKVTDEKGEELAFVNVIVYDKGKIVTGGTTDLEGNYLFTIDFKSDSITLEVKYIEYETIKIDLSTSYLLKNPIQNFTLNHKPYITVGIIVTKPLSKSKIRKLQKVERRKTRD